ncbi:unnamed protein product [Caenorhabditis angaria]|uniref:3-oxo-5alpha-steroid 4-dehydrogenase (NADP(+)) n=1 Tax=Caenorhabditis angaria TaxID=860376 RepID=A0A9P1IRK6_9PELO|nr:unnamed protein product [Caenorhabditis angaria]
MRSLEQFSKKKDLLQYSVPAGLAWFIQEFPAFIIPFVYTFQAKTYYGILANLLVLSHYSNRTFVFPFRLRSKNGSPWFIVLLAVGFCCWNGFIQGCWNANYQPEIRNIDWISIVPGVAIFLTGMLINHRADSILLNLRKPGESGYKIPRGELYEYISCPNYFGEIIEWTGYAIAVQSLPALAFAIFTFCNIGPRAIQHHQWYKSKFPDYPKDRKALIPFIW